MRQARSYQGIRLLLPCSFPPYLPHFTMFAMEHKSCPPLSLFISLTTNFGSPLVMRYISISLYL